MGYRNCRVLVTGGFGFLGSSLVLRLVRNGALVTVIDPIIPGCGGKLTNLAEVHDQIQVIPRDIGDAAAFADELAQAQLVFNLAGEISHIHSMQDPERDLALNTVSQLRFLMTLAKVNPGVRVVYAGTRQVYGRPIALPVNEDHPTQVVDFNGAHKLATAQYHQLLSDTGGLDAVVLRFTNVYGPRLALDVAGQGFLSVFLRKALQGETIEVFGDGQQLRDPLYVEDAVDALLLAGTTPAFQRRVYNVGGSKAYSLLEIARQVQLLAGMEGAVRRRPFPPSHLVFDIGSYYTDSTRIQTDLGWRSPTSLESGLRATLAFYSRESRSPQLSPGSTLQVAPAG